jgi:DNA-binding response OmpR family regulator
MPRVLVATDAEWVRNEVQSVLSGPDTTIETVTSGPEVLPAVQDDPPDLVILDLQIGNMGGMAVALELRLEEGADRLDPSPILMLLDRRADVFLARRSMVEGWLLKPLDPIRLRRAARALLDGGTYHDDAYRPEPVLVTAPSGNVEGSGK